jgi:hypothetical protein
MNPSAMANGTWDSFEVKKPMTTHRLFLPYRIALLLMTLCTVFLTSAYYFQRMQLTFAREALAEESAIVDEQAIQLERQAERIAELESVLRASKTRTIWAGSGGGPKE